MVEVNPPNFIDGQCYTLENFRQVFNGIVCLEGVTATGDLLVTAVGGASIDDTVEAGSAWVAVDLNGAEGMYYVENDAAVVMTIAANGAGSSRIDRIIASVYDSQYIGAADQWAIEVVQGTAGAGVPAVPDSTRSGWLELAQVTVPASGGTPSVVSSLADVMATCGQSAQAHPKCRIATASSGQVIPNNVTTVITQSSITNDDTSVYSTSTANTITILQDGRYNMVGAVAYDDVEDYWGLNIYKNGASVVDVYSTLPAGINYSSKQGTRFAYDLVAGDQITLRSKQIAGGSCTIDYGYLEIVKVD
jgi:hypothetical protein